MSSKTNTIKCKNTFLSEAGGFDFISLAFLPPIYKIKVNLYLFSCLEMGYILFKIVFNLPFLVGTPKTTH